MTVGDWIALLGVFLSGLVAFGTLLGLIWRWTFRIELRLAAIEQTLGVIRDTSQTGQSAKRVIFGRAG